jgi:competence protein ComEC
VGPEAAVISVGEENDYGHPCKDVLGDEGERLFRTDQHGTVELVSDGSQVWVETVSGLSR